MAIISLYVFCSMLMVMWFDITRYIIPNWLVGSLLVLYPVAVWLGRDNLVDWEMAIIGMLIVFAVGYVVFAKNWMGGGDIKLITVLSLWVGHRALPDFIVLFAMLGGVFAMLLLVGRKALQWLPKLAAHKNLPRVLQQGAPVPYGVVIALAFIWMIAQEKVALLSGW